MLPGLFSLPTRIFVFLDLALSFFFVFLPYLLPSVLSHSLFASVSFSSFFEHLLLPVSEPNYHPVPPGRRVNLISYALYTHAYRRKSKYRVFGGLWFGEDKPFFSTFFKPFVETLQQTELHGKYQNA